MRKSTLVLIVIWIISLFSTITFSVLLINDFFKENNINFHSITAGVSSLSESISDTFDYSEDTIISGNYDAINIDTNNKLVIKLSENENIYVSEFHTDHKISEKNKELIIKNSAKHDNKNQLEEKTVLYVPQDQIKKLTIKATDDVSIENVNFDNVDVNMMNGDLNLYNSNIDELSGTLLKGELNNSAKVNDITLKVNEKQ